MTNNSEQLSLINEQPKADNAAVVCLGMTFENEEARRAYFREELRKKLPELKQIEGFPIGEDEDIIALSDPPYYTACPNPWINNFIEEWEREKIERHKRNREEHYNREPFSADVSEGKNDPIYNAHSYHTKVPYKAIMRYLLHYTKPGDIVYDGFCGSGMTGVAAEMCGNSVAVKELGDENSDNIGKRNSVLIDLSPAATFISQNYNKGTDYNKLESELEFELRTLRSEYGWIFSTLHIDNSNDVIDEFVDVIAQNNTELIKEYIERNTSYFGEVNYTVWSEMFLCPSCMEEFSFWEATVNNDGKTVKKNPECPHCAAITRKKDLEKIYETKFDALLGTLVKQPKLVIVKINYKYNGKRFDKKPDQGDLNLLKFISTLNNNRNIVVKEFPHGSETNRPIKEGLTHIHHLYTERNLFIIEKFLNKSHKVSLENKQFLFGSTIPKLTKLNRFMPQHGSRALVGPMANALYFPPLSVENNAIRQLEFQLKKIIKAFNEIQGNVISTQSSTSLKINSNSIDYIFLDPPFGANIMYSELSFAREAWLKVITNNQKEAIENKAQNKTLGDYTELMGEAFHEAFRILKPGHWITVEFSNTQASVWNALQYVIQNSGFIIASVDALDKKRGGFHAMITTTAVNQDLVISAYKPFEENIMKMREKSNTIESAWIFVNQHLENLPVFLGGKGEASTITERTPRILFDRMVAYHVQTGLPIPISSAEFQSGVAQRFPMRDGMVFLESQVAEYDKKRTLVKEFAQMSLFVSDENSAIEWIRQQLMKKPQTRQDLHPQFMKEIQHIAKHEQLPELDDLLVQNFLRYEGDTVVPDQIAGYLRRNYHEYRGLDNNDDKLREKSMNFWYVPDPNKQADLEKLRERALLREFEGYAEQLGTHKKKLSHFRTEAIRAGFKQAWTVKDYKKIVSIGDRLPETVIQEDDKLLMYYDNAQIRIDM